MPLTELESFDVASLPRAGEAAAAEDDAAAANDDDDDEKPLSTLPDSLRADLPAPTLIIGPSLPPPNYCVAQAAAIGPQLPPEQEVRTHACRPRRFDAPALVPRITLVREPCSTWTRLV